jgi:CRISPR-associated protein Csc1
MGKRRARKKAAGERRLSDSFTVVECSIETLDRTLYASREVGDLVDTGDFLLNTALNYAFGFISGKYINSGNKPTYVQDSSEIYNKFYVTPARPEPLEEYLRRYVGIKRSTTEPMPHIGGHSTSYWNARPHQYAVKNWKAANLPTSLKGKNIPKFGRERVLDQQNLLTSYILPYEVEAEYLITRIPRYIRLGKKRSKARVSTRVVEGEIREGEFISNHPFGIYDYEGVPLGDLIAVRMRPVPLIIQGRYRGRYVRLPSMGGDVIIPYKLEFLKLKRQRC